jgi:hypothetical protein
MALISTIVWFVRKRPPRVVCQILQQPPKVWCRVGIWMPPQLFLFHSRREPFPITPRVEQCERRTQQLCCLQKDRAYLLHSWVHSAASVDQAGDQWPPKQQALAKYMYRFSSTFLYLKIGILNYCTLSVKLYFNVTVKYSNTSTI